MVQRLSQRVNVPDFFAHGGVGQVAIVRLLSKLFDHQKEGGAGLDLSLDPIKAFWTDGSLPSASCPGAPSRFWRAIANDTSGYFT